MTNMAGDTWRAFEVELSPGQPNICWEMEVKVDGHVILVGQRGVGGLGRRVVVIEGNSTKGSVRIF